MAKDKITSEEEKQIVIIYGGRYFNNKSTASYVYYLEDDIDSKMLFSTQIIKRSGIGLKIQCIDKGGGTYGNFKSMGIYADLSFINKHVARDASVAYQIAQHKYQSKTPESELDEVKKRIKDLTKGMAYNEKKHFIAGLFADLIGS